MLKRINLTALIKTNIFSILILLLPCAIFAAETDMVVRQKDGRVNTIPGYNKSYAVCIGIDEYKYWRQLNYAVSDAEDVKDLLLSAGFEKVKLIKNGEATKRNILKALTWLGRVAGENDRVVIYYAGHGETQEGRHSKIGFILPVDCPKENYYMEAISMDKLKEAANYIKAKHILYLMDSCYSGIALNSRGDDAFAIAMTRDPVIYMITAGKAGENALEMEGHGIFTNYFLRGLKGEADGDKNDVITGTEIGEYVRKWVVAKAKSKNKSQTPQFGQIDGEGEIVFMPLNRSGKEIQRPNILLPPETKSDTRYYESIANERAQALRKWDGWQKKMSSTYDKYLDLNGKINTLKPSEKAQMWEQFLSTYATDNPHSTEDQMMRNRAVGELDYWQNYKKPIVNASKTSLRLDFKELGVSLQNLTVELSKSSGFEGDSGVLVSTVEPGSPAAQSDIREGDLIKEVNREKINNIKEFQKIWKIIIDKGRDILFLLRRGMHTRVVIIKRNSQNYDEPIVNAVKTPLRLNFKELGVSLQNLTVELSKSSGFEGDSGVLVSTVEPGSPAAQSDIREGDLIKEVNREKINNIKEFQKVWKIIDKGRDILFLLRRGMHTRFVIIKRNSQNYDEPIVNAIKTPLRSNYKDLSVSQVQSIPYISIREKTDWGFYGHSTIEHEFDLETNSGDKVVIDHATGLMWHQSGL